MVVLGISEGPNLGWTSFWTIFLIAGGVLLIIPLIFLERRSLAPILDLDLLSIRNVLIANALVIVSSLSMYLSFLSISYRLELPPPTGFGFDIFTTGLYLLPLAIAMLAVGYPIGVLISKFGVKKFLFIGSAIASFGFFLLSTATVPIQMAEFIVVAAAGLGIIMVSSQNLLVLSVDPRKMGLATSINSVFRNLGAGMGAPLAGAMISTFTAAYTIGHATLYLPTATAFQYIFYAGVIGFIVVFFIAFFAKEVIVTRGRKSKRKSF